MTAQVFVQYKGCGVPTVVHFRAACSPRVKGGVQSTISVDYSTRAYRLQEVDYAEAVGRLSLLRSRDSI